MSLNLTKNYLGVVMVMACAFVCVRPVSLLVGGGLGHARVEANRLEDLNTICRVELL